MLLLFIVFACEKNKYNTTLQKKKMFHPLKRQKYSVLYSGREGLEILRILILGFEMHIF